MKTEKEVRAFLADMRQVCDRSCRDAESPQELLQCAVSVIVAEAKMDLLAWVLNDNAEYDRAIVQMVARHAEEARGKQAPK